MKVVAEQDPEAIKRRVKIEVRRLIKSGTSVATMDITKFAFLFGLDPRDAPGILFDVLRELQDETQEQNV